MESSGSYLVCILTIRPRSPTKRGDHNCQCRRPKNARDRFRKGPPRRPQPPHAAAAAHQQQHTADTTPSWEPPAGAPATAHEAGLPAHKPQQPNSRCGQKNITAGPELAQHCCTAAVGSTAWATPVKATIRTATTPASRGVTLIARGTPAIRHLLETVYPADRAARRRRRKLTSASACADKTCRIAQEEIHTHQTHPDPGGYPTS